MRTYAASTLSLVLALALPACTSAENARRPSTQDPQSITLTDERVSVYNLAGTAEIRGHSGADVIVEVVSGGRDGDALRLAVDRIDGRETLRVVYPSEEVLYSGRSGRGRVQLEVRDDGTFGRGGWSLFSGSGRTRVSSYGSGLEAWADLRILVPEGRDVAVYVGMGDVRVREVDAPLSVDVASGGFESRGTTGDLTVDTGSGSIDVGDATGTLLLDTGSGSIDLRTARGPVRLDTGSGSVRAADVQGDRLEIDTGSGTVEAEGVNVARLAVDTGSGRVRVTGASARDVHLDTGSGSVFASLLSDIEHLDIDTGSGGVTLEIPPTFGAELNIETGSGGIDTRVPVEVEGRHERDRLQGTVGDGRGTVRIDTGSGGVTLRPTS